MITYITTTIPYVNARPHVGFALELVQADALARYRRLCGDETRLQTGTDDNAWKNVESARAQGITPRVFVDRNAEVYRQLNQALGTSADDFVRTTELRHHETVHAVWRRLRPGDVYLKQYTGLYCTGCEDFYLERDLVDGLCPDHKTQPIPVQEENCFFRLSAYQEQIEALIAGGRLAITPEKRRQEVLNFVRQGLQDISISRRSARVEGWGIPVPDDSTQTIYVWIDALINYLTGPGFDYWSLAVRKIHCLGKNVWKFHAVYWPALLLSAGLPVPDELIIHGFLTVNGEKISKSLGNAIDPLGPIATYGADAVRYYLLREVSPWDDGDFSEERLHAAYHQDLANNLGNLVSRLTTLCQRGGFEQFVPDAHPPAPAGYHEALGEYAFDRALGSLWDILTSLNQQIEHAEPWKAIKAGEGSAVHPLFEKWIGKLYDVAYWLAPFLPDTSAKVRAIMEAVPIIPPEPLYPRLE